MLVLETARLILKDVTDQDIAAVHELHLLPETDEFNTLGIPDNIGVTRNVVRNWLLCREEVPPSKYTLAITLKDPGLFIGLIGLTQVSLSSASAEVWYKLHKDHWRRGYTSEALHRLLHFAFTDLGLHRVEAGCAVENIGSARVLEKAGMQREGHCRKKLLIRGQWVDNFTYAILEEDFFRNENNAADENRI